MSDVLDGPWKPLEISPYGAVLHVPATWEALPPVPSNGPEVLRATGGKGKNLIVFKVPTNELTATRVADKAQERLAAHGYGDFTRTEVTFAGRSGIALDFVVRNSQEKIIYRSREYFAVHGNAAWVLGMGSATWDAHLPLIEAIAGRFALTD